MVEYIKHAQCLKSLRLWLQRCFRRLTRLVVIVNYCILTILIVLICISAILTPIKKRQLQSELATLKQAGIPLTYDELLGPPPPVDQNSFPLYMKAHEMLKQRKREIRQDDPSGMSSGNTFLCYDSVDWDNPVKTSILRYWIKQDADIFELLRQASLRPAFRSNVFWEEGPTALLSHYQKLRSLNRLLYDRAILQAQDKDSEGFTNTVLQGYQIAQRIGQEPWLMSLTIAMGNIHVMNRAISIGVTPDNTFTEQQLQQISDKVSQPVYDQMVKTVFNGERISNLQLFDFLPVYSTVYFNYHHRSRAIGSFLLGLMQYQQYDDQICLLHMIDEYQKHIGVPHPDWETDTYCGSAIIPEHDPIQVKLSRTAFLTRTESTGYSGTIARYNKSRTMSNLMQISLGLQLYHQRFHQYPETLDDLRLVKWDVPMDLYSNKPYIYSRQGKSYLLYSLGHDQDDDKGRPISNQLTQEERGYNQANNLYYDNMQDGDIVWRVGFVK